MGVIDDFNSLANSFGVFAQSVNNLISIKREMAGLKVSSKLETEMNNIKSRMFAKVGDPSQITQDNWREAWAEFDNVKKNLMNEYSNDFHTKDYVSNMLNQYDEKFLNTFVADYYQAYRDSTAADFLQVLSSKASQASSDNDIAFMENIYDSKSSILNPKEAEAAKMIVMQARVRVNLNTIISSGKTIDEAKNEYVNKIKSSDSYDEQAKAKLIDKAISYANDLEKSIVSGFDTNIDKLVSDIKEDRVSINNAIEFYQSWRSDAVKIVGRDKLEQASSKFDAVAGVKIAKLEGDSVISSLLESTKEAVFYEDIKKAQKNIDDRIEYYSALGLYGAVNKLTETKQYIATLGQDISQGGGIDSSYYNKALSLRLLYENGSVIEAISGMYNMLGSLNQDSREYTYILKEAISMVQDVSKTDAYKGYTATVIAGLFNNKDTNSIMRSIYEDMESKNTERAANAKATMDKINRIVFKQIVSGENISEANMIAQVTSTLNSYMNGKYKYNTPNNIVYNEKTISSALAQGVDKGLKVGFNESNVGKVSDYNSFSLYVGDAGTKLNLPGGKIGIVKTSSGKQYNAYLANNKIFKVTATGNNISPIEFKEFTDNEFREISAALGGNIKQGFLAKKEVIPTSSGTGNQQKPRGNIK